MTDKGSRPEDGKPTLGISTCLLGEPVRYDGQHKHDRYLTGTVGQFVNFLPVCPEVECGLPVPREAMRLVGTPENPRLVTQKTNIDHTERMLSWAATRVRELEQENLCGYIFKSKSPSSGMERVKVYNDKGMATKNGVGLFAKAVMDHFPLLPCEEEGRLHDMALRENFFDRVFALHRWKRSIENSPTIGRLVEFHTAHKLQLMAHSPEHYRRLGKLVANASKESLNTVLDEYIQGFMQGLSRHATLKKNTNTLQHCLGYFKKQLDAEEKQEMLEIIGDYHGGGLPLIVPVTMVRHFVRKYDQPYLRLQTYLYPTPEEMHLRNHS
jgi:uncharacterized protein YbgA (DUF1722 family)/uncharacterized protein YbbK (DUF523 family)